MAAKLKKRALAEYQSQVEVEDGGSKSSGSVDEEKKSLKSAKKLKLLMPPRRTDSTCSSVTSSSSRRLSCSVDSGIDQLLSQSVLLSQTILDASLSTVEVTDLYQRLYNALQKCMIDEQGYRSQIYLSLANIIISYPQLHLEFNPDWLNSETEDLDLCKASLLSLLCNWFLSGRNLPSAQHNKVLSLLKDHLKASDHQVKIGALKVLGSITHILSAHDRSIAANIMTMINRHTKNQDPRVRKAAFEALLAIHQHGHKLDSGTYNEMAKALKDDYEGVRMIGLKLVQVLALSYPEEQVQDEGNGIQRLIDDAFGKICFAVQDRSVQVRELSVKLIGTLDKVSPTFLEQTLDKKLMSNMRTKKSAHQRQAQIVASGEWSSGKKWADDAPREELDAESVNLMAMGACGAFIHGLEDEFLAVRSASIDSLTALSIKNSKLANMALDFLVDMFNDEIESVRLKAIEALTLIADHICLQAHQLETILWALDDFSFIVREKLHEMLQASNIATKDGLQNVISKLLENLKRYPQDRRSILMTCKKLGSSHAELVLPLVTQLLEIHPFFDTPEPDIEDPSYLCILVLVFNAAEHCPTLGPLLDEHTKRHYHFLEDTYPHLLPVSQKQKLKNNLEFATTANFAKQIMSNVKSAAKMKAEAQLKILGRSSQDLQKLSTIEPALRDAALFAQTYVKCQILMLKCLSGKFWSNGSAQIMQSSILNDHIRELFKLCLQLENKFINLKSPVKKQIKVLRLRIHALHLVFVMKATNKSALNSTELVLKEVEELQKEEEIVQEFPFVKDLLHSLMDESQRKAGILVRILQPLLFKYPMDPIDFDETIKMSHAVIFEPLGNNETPLKYTAGMILAVLVDAELFNVDDHSMVRIAIQTPDQKVMLITPKSGDVIVKSDGSKRLLTKAVMSHQVWSEALNVEMQLVVDVKPSATSQRKNFDNLVSLCSPIKVLVLPKAAKRGI